VPQQAGVPGGGSGVPGHGPGQQGATPRLPGQLGGLQRRFGL
jgi:hypothetical protein